MVGGFSGLDLWEELGYLGLDRNQNIDVNFPMISENLWHLRRQNIYNCGWWLFGV